MPPTATQPVIVEPHIAWGQMLGTPPRPGDPERPAYPSALGLNRAVKAHIRLQAGRPRKHGFHPSELPRLCPALHYYVEQARNDLAADEPEKVVAALEFLKAVVNAKESAFSPEVRMEFRVGSAIHTEVQYRLGVLGYLWGRWKCARCHTITGPGWMPRIWGNDINGERIAEPAPCVRCRGNRRADVPWVYLEPRVENAEWDVTGHADGDLRIKRGEWWYRFILEVKSINEAGFTGKRGPLPKPEHITQASIYGWLMGVSHIVFVYVCKNQVSRWKEFVVPVDPVAVADAQNKIMLVRRARETGEPSPAARYCPSAQDERAKRCPAVERCFGHRPAPSFWEE